MTRFGESFWRDAWSRACRDLLVLVVVAVVAVAVGG